jgi:hypothetical protein
MPSKRLNGISPPSLPVDEDHPNGASLTSPRCVAGWTACCPRARFGAGCRRRLRCERKLRRGAPSTSASWLTQKQPNGPTPSKTIARRSLGSSTRVSSQAPAWPPITAPMPSVTASRQCTAGLNTKITGATAGWSPDGSGLTAAPFELLARAAWAGLVEDRASVVETVRNLGASCSG